MVKILFVIIAVLVGITAGMIISKKFSEGCPP